MTSLRSIQILILCLLPNLPVFANPSKSEEKANKGFSLMLRDLPGCLDSLAPHIREGVVRTNSQYKYRYTCFQKMKNGIAEIIDSKTKRVVLGAMLVSDLPVGLGYRFGNHKSVDFFYWNEEGEIRRVTSDLVSNSSQGLRIFIDKDSTQGVSYQLKNGLKEGHSTEINQVSSNRFNVTYRHFERGIVDGMFYTNPMHFLKFQNGVEIKEDRVSTDDLAKETSGARCFQIEESTDFAELSHQFLFNMNLVQDFKRKPECREPGDGTHQVVVKGVVTKRWTCKGSLIHGNLETRDERSGVLRANQNFREGFPIGPLSLLVGEDTIQLTFKNEKINQICGSPGYYKKVSDLQREDARKIAARKKSFIAPNFSFGTYDRFSSGILFVPRFNVGGIGGIGYLLEAEYLRSDNKNLMRLSAGVGMAIMFTTIFTTVGVRGEQSGIRSTDLTLGIGLTAANFYFRPIYNHSTSKMHYDVGLKFTFPIKSI